MSSISFTLLLTVCFILFARVTANTPFWLAEEYNFVCRSICSDYLKGETYSCMSASGFGLAAGSIIIRILPNFDWRYYTVHEKENAKEFCQGVLAADYFYSHENGTVCSPVFHKNDDDFFYGDIRTRSSGGKRKMDATKMEKLLGFLEEITNLAKEIQKEAMVTDEASLENANKRSESTDVRSKRLFSSIGALAKSVLGAAGLFNTVNTNNIQNINQMYVAPSSIENIGELNTIVQNQEEYIERPYLARRYQKNPGAHHSGTDNTWNDSHDSRADAISFWASKNMCHNRRMVVCLHGICCWAKLNTKSCSLIANDNSINIYRQTIFSLIQAAKFT